jgi:methylenetetrahydrofolate reductase (NADPH)
MKIIEKIKHSVESGQPFYSFEYFPPRTEAGVANLYNRIERMSQLHPMFVDITWGAGGSTAGLTLDIARNIQNLTGLETMMHLTCTNMPREELASALDKARQYGIQNILALRGDPPNGTTTWEACDNGFSYAVDLVRFIREQHGDYFGIGVAGYPYGHEESVSFEQDLHFLKVKVDAGSDFIITQLFYDTDAFLKFVEQCRKIGINCPIIPRIMPIHNYRSFSRMTRFCQELPSDLLEGIERIRNDDEAIRDFGMDYVAKMCEKLLKGGVEGLHFYTLNLEKVVMELLTSRLGMVPEQVERGLPWRQAASARRSHEDVRPIFWANRPKSYLARTMGWDEFPNGRWGDSRSPAFGDIGDGYYMHIPREARLEMWGEEPTSIKDIGNVFKRFCKGEIAAIPWFDSPLEDETNIIRGQLLRLNQHGMWTINSQPRVNGAPSDDPCVGWGGPSGHVYQKAYVEFFLSGEQIEGFIELLQKYPNISYHAVNHEGLSYANCDSVNAVTGGVIPGREIVQPTVVDPDSFVVWKDEAFSLWMGAWASLYEKESASGKLLQMIHDTYFLVNVVDNNFIDGNIWAVFEAFIEKMQKQKW